MLYLILFLFNQAIFATDLSVPTDTQAPHTSVQNKLPVKNTEVAPLTDNQCETLIISQDLQAKYEKLKKSIETDFTKGLPSKLRTRLTSLRIEADLIAQKTYDLQNNNQEINSLVNSTIKSLEDFIQILPAVATNAPQIREQYIMPFANLNSLKAEEQQCLQKARAQASTENAETSSINIYQQLTLELQKMTSNLHQAEISTPQKFIILRSELMETLASYNRNNRLEDAQTLLTIIPTAINAIQSEIEKLLPSLQLSKSYYSISQL